MKVIGAARNSVSKAGQSNPSPMNELVPTIVPTAVVITTADNVVPSSRQRRLARAIPHAAVFELIGDHAVILNDPARFAQLLIAASRSVTGAIAGQAVGGEPA